MRVLIIEEDAVIAARIQILLEAEDVICNTAEVAEDVIEMARLYDYDIIVLGLVWPETNGCRVVRRLRDAQIRTPVLVLSGRTDIDYRLRALASGADDFLAKPFDSRELVARIMAIVRRSHGHAQPLVKIGDLAVDLDLHKVMVRGQTVTLTAKEFAFLHLLCLKKGKVVAKEVILNHLYPSPDLEPEIKIIDVMVCKIRQKLALGDRTATTRYICTSWGRGYFMREPSPATAGTPALATAAVQSAGMEAD